MISASKAEDLNQFTWVCATKNETCWDRWAGHLEISWVENHPIPLFVGHEQGQMVRIVGSSSEAWCSGGIRSFARAWKWWHVHRAPGNGSGWQWWGRSRAFGKAIPCRHLSGIKHHNPKRGSILGATQGSPVIILETTPFSLSTDSWQVFLCEQWAAHSGNHFRFAICFGGRVPKIFPRVQNAGLNQLRSFWLCILRAEGKANSTSQECQPQDPAGLQQVWLSMWVSFETFSVDVDCNIFRYVHQRSPLKSFECTWAENRGSRPLPRWFPCWRTPGRQPPPLQTLFAGLLNQPHVPGSQPHEPLLPWGEHSAGDWMHQHWMVL